MGGITTIINKVKYIGIASLTIAILSVIILNIISSYSSSNTNSNAEPVTQANSTLVSGDAEISLSISSYPSSSSTSGSDLTLQIPQGDGIATGRHTVSVSSNNVTGYEVTLSASETNNSEIARVNNSHNHRSEIPATSGNLTTPSQLANNTWGYTLTSPAGHESDAVWTGLQPSTNRTAIATTSALSVKQILIQSTMVLE